MKLTDLVAMAQLSPSKKAVIRATIRTLGIGAEDYTINIDRQAERLDVSCDGDGCYSISFDQLEGLINENEIPEFSGAAEADVGNPGRGPELAGPLDTDQR